MRDHLADDLVTVLPALAACEPIEHERAPMDGDWVYTTVEFEGVPDVRWDVMAYTKDRIIQWVKLTRIDQ